MCGSYSIWNRLDECVAESLPGVSNIFARGLKSIELNLFSKCLTHCTGVFFCTKVCSEKELFPMEIALEF